MNFNKAVVLTHSLVKEHLGNTYDVKFGVAKRTFGSCYYPTATRKGYIRLSKILIESNTEEHVLDTILHEIAHALAGFDAHHGYAWQVIAKQLGAKTTACKEGNVAEPKYVVYSPLTKSITQRYYRKPNAARYANLHHMQVKGRPETMGTLVILTYQEYKSV